MTTDATHKLLYLLHNKQFFHDFYSESDFGTKNNEEEGKICKIFATGVKQE